MFCVQLWGHLNKHAKGGDAYKFLNDSGNIVLRRY